MATGLWASSLETGRTVCGKLGLSILQARPRPSTEATTGKSREQNISSRTFNKLSKEAKSDAKGESGRVAVYLPPFRRRAASGPLAPGFKSINADAVADLKIGKAASFSAKLSDIRVNGYHTKSENRRSVPWDRKCVAERLERAEPSNQRQNVRMSAIPFLRL